MNWRLWRIPYADLAVGDVKGSDVPMGHSPAHCQMPDLYKGPLVTPRFTHPEDGKCRSCRNTWYSSHLYAARSLKPIQSTERLSQKLGIGTAKKKKQPLESAERERRYNLQAYLQTQTERSWRRKVVICLWICRRNVQRELWIYIYNGTECWKYKQQQQVAEIIRIENQTRCHNISKFYFIFI